MEEFEMEMGIELFISDGHAFYPENMAGIGEVTRILTREGMGYVTCSAERFYKELCESMCKSPSLLRKYSRRILQQTKFVPTVLREDLLFVRFPYSCRTGKKQPVAYVRFSSIKDISCCSASTESKIILEDGYILHVPRSIKFLFRQKHQADVLLTYYLNSFF